MKATATIANEKSKWSKFLPWSLSKFLPWSLLAFFNYPSKLTLLLVSCDLESVSEATGRDNSPINVVVKRSSVDVNEVKYEADFSVPGDFGEIGAVFVQHHHCNCKEMYLKKIELDFPNGPPDGSNRRIFTCNSYVQRSDGSNKRIFFSNKSYLPSQTPSGLKRLREEELENLRGNGKGERKSTDRIYDYDVYNDLGNPDEKAGLARPVLGGKKHPYPRRCRTGRARCKTDPLSEQRSSSIYVPRDEAFSDVKGKTFTEAKTLLRKFVTDQEESSRGKTFSNFKAIDELYNEEPTRSEKVADWELDEPMSGTHKYIKKVADWELDEPMSSIYKYIKKAADWILKFITKRFMRFDTPKLIKRDKFSWLRDEEFSRETLAGINPCTIELVTELPFGPNVKERVEREIGGIMKLEEALEEKRLFMLDYHDLLLPFVNKVRALSPPNGSFETTLYGSRTLFFLNPDGMLRPLAIELTRPAAADEKPQWKEVFTPEWSATGYWLWRLAKAHVLAHDSGVHQLISHWLRTHCCVEPYAIATNRQLSVMHPIYRLLHPHLRYTMEINAKARQILINADGIIESSFSTGKHSMELSSAAYDQQWRFDLQALPADLISRGMAVEDETAPHHLKLAIEDYPYANDGLLLWDAIEQWVTDYVSYYYSEESLNPVESDQELQSWWTEIRTVGHRDKKEGWPELRTPKDLIGILTTMIWVASGHHAAVNFGQYDYAGYFPNRPTIARKNMPTEEYTEEKWNDFLKSPEATLLKLFPSQDQAENVMNILNLLSSHSPDEEYLGKEPEAAWAEELVINAAFGRFNRKLKEIERTVDSWNMTAKLRNRSGAGVVSYELLKPFLESGVTGKGVPKSISI